jgi:predicted O-methyltransferase YrrM
MLKRYQTLVGELKPRKIFELGIWQGGSSVFLHKISAAEKLVSIDISEERITALDDYIEGNQLGSSLKPLYGVDQSDIGRLRKIVMDEFQGGELDLVVDGASHYLDETRNSFNALFPLVRPGGIYIIEDWPWAHGNIEMEDDEPFFFEDREPMTKLIFEIILACPSAYSYIENIEIDRNSATIRRGHGKIPVDDFDIAQCSLARGRSLIR